MAPSTGRWLFLTQNDYLENYAKPEYYGDSRKLRTLKVQVFIFHQDRLLLLEKTTSNKWTAPYKLVPYSKEAPQTIWKAILRMLSQTIQERKLIDLQFPDLNTNIAHVLEQWKVEEAATVKTLQLNVILTVESAALDDRTAIDCSFKFAEMRWFTMEEASKLILDGLPVLRLTRCFDQLKRYIRHQNHLILGIQAGADTSQVFPHVRDFVANAAHIRVGLQTVYRGYLVPDAIMLLRKEMESSPLFIMDVPSEIHKSTVMDHQDLSGHQEVSTRIPLPGGKYKTTYYVVVGKTMDGEVHFKRNLVMKDITGVLGGGSRVRIDWLQWNRETRLISGRCKFEKNHNENMRDSAFAEFNPLV